MPLLRLTRTSFAELTKNHGRVPGSVGRLGPWLVVTQVALSLVLLVNTGLLVRTVEEIRNVEPGYQPEGVFIAYPHPRPQAYRDIDNDTYYPQLVDRLRVLPSVQAVGISQLKTAGGGTYSEPVAVVGAPPAAAVVAEFTPLSPGFFDVLQVPFAAGRDFTWADNSKGRPVAVLSSSLEQRLFPGESALGRHVRIGVLEHRQRLEVVGVVADARVYDRKSATMLAAYVPSLQEVAMASGKSVIIRANHLSLADVRTAVESLGREYVSQLQPLPYTADRAILRERLTATVASFFGGLTLLLATIGLYGLISYSVKRKDKEIAIRLALGARPGRIVRSVVGSGLAIAGLGVAVGLGAALLTTRLVQSLLFGVSTYDARTLLGAPALLVFVAVLACLVPAVRAARVQPTTTLRAE